MNEMASGFAGIGRKWGAILVMLTFAVTASAATFRLPMPMRPTSFPLSIPGDPGAGVLGWGYNGDGRITIPASATNVACRCI